MMYVPPVPTSAVGRSSVRLLADGSDEVGAVVLAPGSSAADIAGELVRRFTAERGSGSWRIMDDSYRWSRAPASTSVGDLIASPNLQVVDRFDDEARFGVRRLWNAPDGDAGRFFEIEICFSPIDPRRAPERASELLEWITGAVGDHEGVSGFVGLGAVFDRFRLLLASDWRSSLLAEHVADGAPGYYWAMLLSDRWLAALDEAALQGDVELATRPSGAVLTASSSADDLTADQMASMRRAVWPLLGLHFVAYGPTRPLLLFEGGPGRDVAQRLSVSDQRGELRAMGAVSQVDGMPYAATVGFKEPPDELSITELGWTLDAWRRAAAFYRSADDPSPLEWEEWMPYRLAVDGQEVRVTMAGPEPGPWRELLTRVLRMKAREAMTARHGDVAMTEVVVE